MSSDSIFSNSRFLGGTARAVYLARLTKRHATLSNDAFWESYAGPGDG